MHIQSFDTFEDMQDAMATAEDAANASLTPGQIMLRDRAEETTYWAQALPDMDLVVYAEVPPVPADLRENRERGYLTGTAYSAWEPSGEYGDTHVSQVVPINADLFETAKMLDFPSWSVLRDPQCAALAHALALAEMFSQKGLPV